MVQTKTSMAEITLSPSGASMIGIAAAQSSGASERLEQSKLALNAAIGYFSYEIDSKCDGDCSTWKSLSNVSDSPRRSG